MKRQFLLESIIHMILLTTLVYYGIYKENLTIGFILLFIIFIYFLITHLLKKNKKIYTFERTNYNPVVIGGWIIVLIMNMLQVPFLYSSMVLLLMVLVNDIVCYVYNFKW